MRTEKEAGLWRTSMYVGGSSPGKMIEAAFYHEDCVVYDLEDAVAPDEKDAARFLVYQAICTNRPADKYVIVRVNGIYSDWIAEDLEAMVRARPDAIRLPKVEHADEVRGIDARIAAIEKNAGLPVGGIALWCNIESAAGVAHAAEIAAACPRVAALALGAEDYTADIGAQRTREGLEIFYARSRIIEACRLAGISAQDAVFSNLEDDEGLRRDLEMAKILGFDGKTVVHPRQVDATNVAFAPTPREIRRAEAVLLALQKSAAEHTGVTVVDGSMVDRPMELRARSVLARARAAGLVTEEQTDADK